MSTERGEQMLAPFLFGLMAPAPLCGAGIGLSISASAIWLDGALCGRNLVQLMNSGITFDSQALNEEMTNIETYDRFQEERFSVSLFRDVSISLTLPTDEEVDDELQFWR